MSALEVAALRDLLGKEGRTGRALWQRLREHNARVTFAEMYLWIGQLERWGMVVSWQEPGETVWRFRANEGP